MRAASPMVAGAHHHAHHHQRLVASGAHPGAVRPSPGAGATTYAVARAGTLAAGGAQVATGVPLLQQQQRLVVVSTPGSAPSSRAQSPVAATGVQGASSSAGGGEYMLQLVQKTNAREWAPLSCRPKVCNISKGPFTHLRTIAREGLRRGSTLVLCRKGPKHFQPTCILMLCSLHTF